MRVKRNVFLVESDVAQRKVLSGLLASSRYKVQEFPSAEAFLENSESITEGIMLLEQSLPGMSGLELQGALTRRGTELPIVFISGRKDVRVIVNAMKAGAIDFLARPFSNEELLTSVKDAFSRADDNQQNHLWVADLKRCYETLTDREREVIEHVIEGRSSKDVAELLGVSHRTIDVHRTHLMRKMGVKPLVDLARKYAICQNSGSYRLRGSGTRKKAH